MFHTLEKLNIFNVQSPKELDKLVLKLEEDMKIWEIVSFGLLPGEEV
jgi:hypothetical protein